jgi:crotonobetainyl-CoA:carnitine CoA-transferase CaiB-like acyl-CoA transferase
MAGPLEGYKVVELSRGVAGPMAGMFFADYGAEVIRIEPPGGDPYRGHLPGYHVWNRGKRSLTLDLKSVAGSELLNRLLRGADVIIAALSPGAGERLGIDYPTLSARFPSLVCCSISGYGDPALDRGHRAFEALIHARSGLCNEQPGFRPGPNFGYFPTASYGAAILTVIGATAALYARGRGGAGQQVRVSLMDGVRAALALQLAWAQKPTRNLMVPSSSSAGATAHLRRTPIDAPTGAISISIPAPRVRSSACAGSSAARRRIFPATIPLTSSAIPNRAIASACC